MKREFTLQLAEIDPHTFEHNHNCHGCNMRLICWDHRCLAGEHVGPHRCSFCRTRESKRPTRRCPHCGHDTPLVDGCPWCKEPSYSAEFNVRVKDWKGVHP